MGKRKYENTAHMRKGRLVAGEIEIVEGMRKFPFVGIESSSPRLLK